MKRHCMPRNGRMIIRCEFGKILGGGGEIYQTVLPQKHCPEGMRRSTRNVSEDNAQATSMRQRMFAGHCFEKYNT
jgi:hypothetical protein